MVHSMVMPSVLRFQTDLANNIHSLKMLGLEDSTTYQKDRMKRIIKNIDAVNAGLEKMHKALEKAHHADNIREEAGILCHKVKPQMDVIREAVDELEGLVDDQLWPLVKYREMLFVR